MYCVLRTMIILINFKQVFLIGFQNSLKTCNITSKFTIYTRTESTDYD